MPTDPTLLELLHYIKKDQWAFLGDTHNKYASLTGFIMGYAYGLRYSVGDLSREVFPRAFNDFVRIELNKRHGTGKYDETQHWFNILVLEAGDSDKAFELFYQMLEQFEERE